MHALQSVLCAALAAISTEIPVSAADAPADAWREDPIWFDGRAEWAVYRASRVIYGSARTYDATIFTVAQHMDPGSGVKSEDHRDPDAAAVFKLVISEIIPTPNYDYRMLRTAFLHRNDLSPFSLVASTQEECGASFRRFVVRDGMMDAYAFSYFPGAGVRELRIPAPENLVFHDGLPLSLRSHPFTPEGAHAPMKIMLVPGQNDPLPTGLEPAEATVTFEGRETLDLPIGRIDADRLLIRHEAFGEHDETRVWIAVDPALRRVMVRYQGPYSTTWELARLDRWAYWSDPRPAPPDDEKANN